MKTIITLLALAALSACSDTYRYPCQDPDNLKKQVMTATKQGGKTVYLPGLVA